MSISPWPKIDQERSAGAESYVNPRLKTITEVESFELRKAHPRWEERRAAGKEVRREVPRSGHAKWTPPKGRPDPVEILNASNRGRQEHLIPLRMGRMAASPFAFLRGAAAVMAWDLAQTPVTGISVIIDGDAHVNNFGLYGTPQRDVVFDLNDFDEATYGPWEWDLKRLVASVNVAGRDNGLNRRDRRDAVLRCVEGYRWNCKRLQGMGVLDVWYLHANTDRWLSIAKIDPKAKALFLKAVEKAKQQTNAALMAKMVDKDANGTLWFRSAPPVLTSLDRETKEKVIEGLNSYEASILPERRVMLRRYSVVDVVHRVAGVGSVGTRAYVVLLLGNGGADPLFLQVKESAAPAHGPYVPPLPGAYEHHGRRVVMGQRLLAASTDVMLGWTTIDGRPFFVRQMKNMKGSIPVEFLVGEPFNFYAWSCGALLARAHSRVGDSAAIAGYCGNSAALDAALSDWAEAYGEQTEIDHASLVRAIKTGRVKAVEEAR